MKLGRTREWPSWWGALALLALLVALAVLQYRWLDQVRRADRERRLNLLQATAQAFVDELDTEVSRAVLVFQGGYVLDPGTAVPLGLAAWESTAREPRLIGDVWLLRPTGSDPRFQRFDEEEGRFAEAPAPEPLAQLSAWLAETAQVEDSRSRPRRGPLLLDPLGVIVPRRASRRRSDLLGPGPPGRSLEYLFVGFDREVLESRYLPDLVDRYFGGESSLKYRVELGEPQGSAWFAAGPQPAGRTESGRVDLSLPAFRLLPPDRMRRLGLSLPRPETESRGQRSRQRRLDDWRRSFTALALGGAAGSEGLELRLTHVSGSLDRAVQAAMRQNLAVGMASLLLLGAGVLLLDRSARRARSTARQQIDFVAGITHELMTPLAAVRSAGQNLADGVVTDPNQVRRYGTLVEAEGRRLSGMVAELLDLAGIQSGRKSYRLAPTAPAEVVSRALGHYRPALEQAGFEIDLAIEEGLPEVSADAEALGRAVENLVANALKYAQDGGWLGVAVRRVGARVEIEIADRGPGINEAEAERIFEPFVRGESLVASNQPGTGLGLSLVRHILEAHGGSVRVQAGGPGARFVASLPAVGAEA